MKNVFVLIKMQYLMRLTCNVTVYNKDGRMRIQSVSNVLKMLRWLTITVHVMILKCIMIKKLTIVSVNQTIWMRTIIALNALKALLVKKEKCAFVLNSNFLIYKIEFVFAQTHNILKTISACNAHQTSILMV